MSRSGSWVELLKTWTGKLGRAFQLMLGTVFILAILYHAFGPISAEEKQRLEDGKVDVQMELLTNIPNAETRLQIQGNNLEVYITVNAFEAIPYPDRKDFVARIGRVWCGKAHGIGFSPSLRIRDIRTGKSLGGYGCLSREPSLTQ
jgi:hypothetical protein